jgi:hypothetical protein
MPLNITFGSMSKRGMSSSSNFRPVVATGGTTSTITVNGIQFKVHIFNSGTNNFTVSDAGTLGIVEALVVGGGGSGGYGHGGGGGAGAVLYRTNQPVSASTYSVVIGTGGQATSNAAAANGGNSSAFGVTATGGGQGANESGDDSSGRAGIGQGGANGGGGSYGFIAGGTGSAPSAPGWTVYAGSNGGTGGSNGAPAYTSGGGGGANQIGQPAIEVVTAVFTSSGGRGGDGILIPITGNNYYWGGGGGGVVYGWSTGTHIAGYGGVGGGGGSSAYGSYGTNIQGLSIKGGALNFGGDGTVGNDQIGGAGGANTGAGGGSGSNENGTGGAGGSGIVVIRYPLTNPTGNYPPTYTTGLMAGINTATMTGGTAWFNQSTPYYGVESSASCKLSSGTKINQFNFREGNSVGNTSMWFLVMEQDISNSYKYYLIAGWRFTQASGGNSSVLTYNASSATSTIGVSNTDKSFVIPTGAVFSSGNYYMGWVSSDPRGLSAKNSCIYVNASSGGNIHYDTVNNVGGYPDQLGVGFARIFVEGKSTGNVVHMGFNGV